MKPTIRGESTKPRCFVYLRRSQDRDDRQQQSIEKQEAQVRKLVKDNDLEAVFLPREERSARSLGRPVFQRMVEGLENGEARYIAVWNLSRLSRNPVDAGRIIRLLDTGKLLGIYTPNRVYKNNSDDKTFLAIELAFTKKENDDLSERVREGFEVKRNHGEYPGPAPVGYVNIITGPGKRNIAPDPENAHKVINLFQLAATGQYKLNDLWLEAQSLKLTLPRSNKVIASRQTLAEMLKRGTYAGLFKYGGEGPFKGSYEPLISMDLYDKVQYAMGWSQTGRRSPSTTAGRYFVYKGLFMCENCGFNVTAYIKSKKLKSGEDVEYIYYGCTKKNKTIECKEHQVSEPSLKKEIIERISEFSISKEDAEEAIKWLRRFHADYIRKKNQYRPIWLEDQRGARSALEVLDQKLEEGVMTDDRYRARAKHHEDILARTQQLLSKSDQDTTRWLELAEETFSSAVNLEQVFVEANDEEKRKLMTLFGSNWKLGNKKVALTVREPLQFLQGGSSINSWRARPDSNRRSSP